jgi:hypothetical protein
MAGALRDKGWLMTFSRLERHKLDKRYEIRNKNLK